MLRRLLIAASLIVAAASSADAQTPVAGRFTYTAQLNADALATGQVDAGGIVWQCSGRTCTVTGPWSAPGVPACVALAARVGAIASYGRPGAVLNATQLAQCNAQVRPRITLDPSVIRAPSPRVIVPSNPGATPSNPTAAPSASGVSVRTATMTVTGTGALGGGFSAVTVRTNTMTLTGTGALAPGEFAPVTVRTQTMTLTGAPP
jgi:hypothetical protein